MLNTEHQTDISTKTKIQRPKKYKVLMHNDNYSTWEFVIGVLKRVFYKDEEEAIKITTQIHNNGVEVCGVYPHEIAVMKMEQVHTLATANNYPLKCSIEVE